MSILVLSSTYPSPLRGGSFLSAPDFVQRLSSFYAGDHRTVVVVPSSDASISFSRQHNLKEVFFPYFFPYISSLVGKGGIPDRLRSNPFRLFQAPFLVFFHFVFSLIEALKLKGGFVIHCHWIIYCGLVGILLKKILFWRRISVVVTIHGSDSTFFDSFISRLICGFVINNSDAVTCVSREVSLNVKDHFGVSSYVMPMGVSECFFVQNSGEERSQGCVLFVGRVVESKGIEYLINSLKFLPDNYHLKIIGDGPYSKECRRIVRLKGLETRVHFLGWLGEEDIARQMRVSGCLALPSMSEGFSVTILEAMASRLPVVGNNIPSIAVQLCESRGYLVDVTNPRVLASGIVDASQDLFRTVEGAAAYAEQYSWSNVAYGYLGLVNSLLSSD